MRHLIPADPQDWPARRPVLPCTGNCHEGRGCDCVPDVPDEGEQIGAALAFMRSVAFWGVLLRWIGLAVLLVCVCFAASLIASETLDFFRRFFA